jgi:hypothetical protein
MAKPNYAFAKRQRDLAKKKKKEAKRLRKAGNVANESPDGESRTREGGDGATTGTE